jgi:hypothetical protein
MHYSNGQPAKAGDLLIRREFYRQGGIEVGNEVIGVLAGAQSQSTTCNGNLVVLARRIKSELGFGPWLSVPFSGNEWSVTLSQCLPIETNELFPPLMPKLK